MQNASYYFDSNVSSATIIVQNTCVFTPEDVLSKPMGFCTIIVAELTFDQSNRKRSASLMVSLSLMKRARVGDHLNFRRCLK